MLDDECPEMDLNDYWSLHRKSYLDKVTADINSRSLFLNEELVKRYESQRQDVTEKNTFAVIPLYEDYELEDSSKSEGGLIHSSNRKYLVNGIWMKRCKIARMPNENVYKSILDYDFGNIHGLECLCSLCHPQPVEPPPYGCIFFTE